MRLPVELVSELVPEGNPPEELLSNQVYQIAEQIEDYKLRNSYLWSIALNTAGIESNLPIPNKLSNCSAGFVYINKENLSKLSNSFIIEGFSFGITLNISSIVEHFQEVRTLQINDMVIPVVINYGTFEPHGLPTHPNNGTGTCWVKNNKLNESWENGILTCRHTLDTFVLGDPINLYPSNDYAAPTNGTLADKDICTIDAAIVKIDAQEFPNKLRHLPICSAVSPGQSFSFKGRKSSGTGTVLRVFQHPNYVGNLFGQRIFIDCVGIPGDSGSLIIDSVNRDGLGIYMGSVPDGSGGHEGVCQHLYQAASYFDFSTFL